ncbi:type I polyketide synthase [Frankia saprophytica]
MTRVSDIPEFAKAVADGGGLPFLALALLSGEQSRALLAQTAEQLGEAPWGVGILGFAPAEVRAAQLDAVLAVRPPCALIAGGRPSQAAPLEAAGIDTFLHVPSPGLLERFVADGARKFVFEGRECGGHVGPRASFALWEAQVGALLAAGERLGGGFFEELHLLFAGGVHDEASAAAVAAVAAPLAARGAKVGALMGTAYLFTAEAVASGAIQPGFQEAAVRCEETVLLETSPGHATRCVRSPFVDTFLSTRAELAAAGHSRHEMWATLEGLNLGRLRIASKGVRRDGGALVAVDETAQAAEGMFMIGQVAALRAERTSIPVLHEQVSTGAGDALARRAAELGLAVDGAGTGASAAAAARGIPAQQGAGDENAVVDPIAARRAAAARSVAAVRETARPADIAIIGMAGVFPGAPDVETFWANILGGVDAVTEVPAERFEADRFYSPDAFVKDAGKMTPSKWGGFLPPIPFDALAYGIPPRSLRSIETGQLLALEVSARALRDAGYEKRPFDRSRTSVVFGAEAGADLSGAYGLRAGYRALVGDLPAELDEHLPELDEDSFPGILANVIAGRVANRLDFGGANFTVDAACASSFAALDAACKELLAGNSDMVLCGGVDTHNGLNDFLMFASVHALSPSGRCRSFDSSADGITLGEGVAVVVLKRLADAERDGDRIHAVVKAVAGSSDGRALGLTAPRRAGQVLSLERAYSRAGISPSEVGLVEAHATGTVVGDRTELATLTEVFAQHGAEPGACTVGSVKSQIGHAKCAAGMAGLIKATRALAAGVRPPTLHIETPNEAYDRASSPFAFDKAARPWAAPASERHAGVSAFGFGGTNFHVVLSAYDGGPEPAHGLAHWPAELFVIRGADNATAARRLDRLTELAQTNEDAGRPWRLRDLARTIAEDRSGPVRLAFVVSSLDELPAALARARSFQPDPKAGLFVAPDAPATAGATGAEVSGPGRVGFLFPGQGSQRPGMLADLFVAFPRLREVLELGPRWAGTMFPPAALSRAEADAQAAAITDTRAAQPTLGLAGLAMAELLGSLGIHADDLAGHSYGELVALSVAGALDRADLIGLSEARAAAILAAAGEDPGTMAAVSAPAADVRAALDAAGGRAAEVVLANQNAPKQTVVSGPTAAVDAALAALSAAGLAAKRIPVAAAFHSPVVAGAAGTLADTLAGLTVSPAAARVWANTTAAPYPDTAAEIRATLAGQVAAPVRFVEQVEAMYAAGVRTFVEVGPGRVLTGLVGKILAGRPHRAVATDVAGEPGLRRLLLAAAELAAAGVTLDIAPLFAGRDARVVSAADAPRRPGWLVDGAFVRTADGRVVAGGLKPLARLEIESAASPAVPAVFAAPADPTADTAVLEFLRTTRDLVSAQRDVLLGYLGRGGAAALDAGTLAGLGGAAGARLAPVDDGRTYEPAQVGRLAAANGHAPVIPAQAFPVDQPSPSVPAPAAASAGRGLGRAVVLDTVVEVIGSQTGYPAEMLEPGLDLEADLSIDSIKRTEILGELAGRLGLADAAGGELDESVVEELAAIKTVDGIVDWIVARSPGSSQQASQQGATQVVAVPAQAVPAAAVAAVSGRGAVLDVVVEVIGSQTGYPAEMLEPGLDLEADLSIDSIKRTEILGELAGRLGLADAAGGELDESVVEELAAIKTVDGIVDWIVAHQASPATATAAAAGAPAVPVAAGGALPPGAVPFQPTPARSDVPAMAGTLAAPYLNGASSASPAPPPGLAGGGGAPPLGRPAVLDTVVEVIGSQTGYPAEMLEPGLDLEADLSIDSIKRTEILGELAGRLGLADAAGGELDESVVEELAAIKTVDGIVDWIVAHTAAKATDVGETGTEHSVAEEHLAAEPELVGGARFPLRRFVVEPGPLPAVGSTALGSRGSAVAGGLPGDGTPLAGGRFAVVEGGLGVGLEIADLLEQAGATVRLLDAGAPDLAEVVAGGVAADGLLWVAALDAAAGSAAELPGAFAALRAAALGGTRRLVLASGLGGDFGRRGGAAATEPAPVAGAGFAGFARTLAYELPDVAVRVVDVDPKDAPRRIAESLLGELVAEHAPLVVGYRDGARSALRVLPAELTAQSTDAAAPMLDSSSVVLLTGGARGITAKVALEIARRHGAHIELVGRTSPPAGPEDPATSAATDAPALRRALIATGMRRPAEIEARLARLLAEREVRATLAELDRTAASVRYHAVDVRDGAAVRAVVADVYARHGRLDGVVHGAGVLEDRLLRDKTPESFARVYSTKVDGARALLAALRRDRGPRFVALFGSVAGVFGNRGQVDYAAANDTLDTLAHAHAGVFPASALTSREDSAKPAEVMPAQVAGRVVSVDWGPWRAEGGGMVSAELEREYARRGIGLIEPAEGVDALLRELAAPAGPAQVVYMCGEVDAFYG